MKRLIYTAMVGMILFSGTVEKASDIANKTIKEYPSEKTVTINPYELREKYLPKKELYKILTELDHLIPKEFSKKDLEKIAMIESSMNENAYREDIIKKVTKQGIEKDTIRQGGIFQVTEDAYNAYEKNEPFLKGVFNPYKNTKSFLKNLGTIRQFYQTKVPDWHSLNLEEKQKYIIAGHNYGIGKFQSKNFNLSKVPAVTKNFFKKFYSHKSYSGVGN